MDLGPLRNALQTSWVETDNYELSFFGDNDLSIEEIASAAQRPVPRLPHPKIRVSTVGDIRGLRLEPLREGTFPHLVIRFQISPTDDELLELTNSFGEPIDNPAIRTRMSES